MQAKGVQKGESQLKELLDDMCENHLSPEILPRAISDEYKQVMAELDTERELFLRELIVHHEIENMVLDESSERSGDNDNELSDHLSAAEVSQLLHLPAVDSTHDNTLHTVFGLTPDSFAFASGGEKMRQELEDRLQSKYERLSKFCCTVVGSESEVHEFQAVDRLKLQLQSRRRVLAQQRAACHRRVGELRESCSELLALAHSLLQHHQVETNFPQQQQFLSWHQQRLETLVAKMEVMKWRSQQRAYRPDTIKALAKIRDILVGEELRTEQETKQHRDRLAQYSECDEGFEGLVKEYAQVLKNIETTGWNIKQMQ